MTPATSFPKNGTGEEIDASYEFQPDTDNIDIPPTGNVASADYQPKAISYPQGDKAANEAAGADVPIRRTSGQKICVTVGISNDETGDRQTIVMVYSPGEEQTVIDAVMASAKNEETGLTVHDIWEIAEVLSKTTVTVLAQQNAKSELQRAADAIESKFRGILGEDLWSQVSAKLDAAAGK